MAKAQDTAREMRGMRKALYTASLMLLAIAVQGEGAVLPLTYNIYEAFGDGLIGNYIVSSAALWMAIGAVLSTVLLRKMTKKSVLVLGSALFTVGSVFCATVNNAYYVAFMRSLMGFGEGVVSSTVMAYIAQMYVDEGHRASVTGYFNAFGTIVGAALSFCAGALSIPDWTRAFLVFLPTIPALVCAILFLPELGMETYEAVAPDGEEAPAREGLGMLFYTFIFDYFIFVVMYAVIAYYISVYLIEVGVGDASLAGTLVAVSTGTGFITSVAFGPLYAKLRKATSIPCIAADIIALLLLYFAPSIVACFVAMALIGLSFGAYFSYGYAYVAEIVPPSRVDDAIGYTTAGYSILFFVSPFAISWGMGFTNGLVRPLYLVAAALGAVGILIELATQAPYKKMQDER